jgi:hypothetical protein
MRAQKWLSLLLLYNLLLVLILAMKYSYNLLAALESLAACLLLVGVTALVGFPWLRPRASRTPRRYAILPAAQPAATGFGLGVGLLWAIEIGINNFLAPPLPGRDIIDNLFWGAIAILLFAGSLIAAWQARRWRSGVSFGFWSGLASGAVACGMALAMVVFGMRFLLHDPLNVAEWGARSVSEPAPSMAAYFAYQTLAGALLHLIGLGALMGAALGALGGAGRCLRGHPATEMIE